MLRDILLSYGVLFGSAAISFLTAIIFGHGLRLERQALEEAYRSLCSSVDEPPQMNLPNHQRIGLSA